MKKSLLVLTAILLLLLCAGCRTTSWSERDQSNMLDLQRGVRIDLVARDGSVEHGYYIGTRTMEFTEYVPNYHKLVNKHPECRFLPVPGEHISFTTRLTDHAYDRVAWEGDLVGFDSKYLWVRLNGESEPTCYWVSSITNLMRWNGCLLQKMQIAAMIEKNQLPYMIEIAMSTDEGVKHIPLNNMRHIQLREGADPASLRIFAEDLGEEFAARFVKTAGDR
jgi:hypothetical protein